MVNEAIDREIEGWQLFESIMYQDDRSVFAEMMTKAKNYLSDFPASRHDTAEVLILNLIFKQQKTINTLLAVIEAKGRQKA